MVRTVPEPTPFPERVFTIFDTTIFTEPIRKDAF